MCLECGCGRPGPTKIDGKPMEDRGHDHPYDDDHDDDHDHDHGHDHGHEHPHREIEVHQSIFAANDRQAERNRGFFSALNLLVLNAVSSPGSGKTSLLVKTIERLSPALRTGVVVGDLETDNDARRLRTTGAPVVQISTGTLCHLDATMVSKAAASLPLPELDLLVVENVGNLVCPAEFDLGENLRIALLSVTEGEDKPLKYPPLFRGADAVLVTKTDLAGPCEFDRDAALANLRRVNPKARVFELSAKTGAGMDAWCDFLRESRALVAASR